MKKTKLGIQQTDVKVFHPRILALLPNLTIMIRTLKDLTFAVLIILIVGLFAIGFLPIIPIDETRCLSVAWEMWLHKSFLIPILNGVPYSHKPPFFFWLIQITWALFGVNDVTPRLIPMIFGIVDLFLIYKISLILWPGRRETARLAVLLLAATTLWLIWSFLILYELILAFWVLVGIIGILNASRADGAKGWLLLTMGIAGGILTKGPVILVHLVPITATVFWWAPQRPKSLTSWYAKALVSLLLGIVCAGIWVVPAAIKGGEGYRHAILWGQTARRIAASFAHRRPIWWYLPFLPMLLFPWSLFKFPWQALFSRKVTKEEGNRFCLVWFLITLVEFSLISGKQFYYLIPAIPAITLLIAHNIPSESSKDGISSERPWGLGTLMILLGGGLLCLPFFSLSPNTGRLPFSGVAPLAGTLLGLGGFSLFHKFKSTEELVKWGGITTTIVLSFVILFAGHEMAKRYDLKPLAKLIKTEAKKGRCIVYIGHYNGEFQYLGRLEKPLLVLKNGAKDFIKSHPHCLVVCTIKGALPPRIERGEIFFERPFREEKKFIVISGRGYLECVETLTQPKAQKRN